MKVISKDSSCSSGVDGSTTICDNGRIISMGSDPEKNTNAVFGYGMYSAKQARSVIGIFHRTNQELYDLQY
jgi:hypothetical protein